jgi:hypothetical protein
MRLNQSNVVELVANAVRTSTLTPATGVYVADYDGPCHLILQSSAATAGTTPTLNVKLQHSDVAGSGFADVTGVAFSEVTDADLTEMLTVQIGALKKYIRCVGTIAGTDTPTFGFGVTMVGCLQSGRNASQSI